ncbi:MAG TPA: hypothetical protein VK157_04100 [Phycisphaerales bacterium]|nr:hypothetical protein [Phycisphaerales bacterium]
MQSWKRSSALAGRVCGASLVLAAGAVAQPTLIISGVAVTDISPDGTKVVGSIYDANALAGFPTIETRGVGTQRINRPMISGYARMSPDMTTVSFNAGNAENLNNAANTITYNSSIPNQWESVSVGHLWTNTGGIFNIGPANNGNRCDFNINSVTGISGSGQFLAVNGWTNGLCGPFRATRYDASTDTFTQLPVSLAPPPSNQFSLATRVFDISDDGDTLVGGDSNWNTSFTIRQYRAAVWTRNPATNTWTLNVLDPNGGELFRISGNGQVATGRDATGQACRWVRGAGNTWTKTTLGTTGLPTSINHDGSVIAGDLFIWRADLNGGQAVDLYQHIANLGGGFPGITFYNPFGAITWGVSDDGTRIALRGLNETNPCLSTFFNAVLDLDGGPCEAPRIALDPVSEFDGGLTPGNFGMAFNVMASGTYPLNYVWQKQDATGAWVDVVDDNCGTFDARFFDATGSRTSQLRLGFYNDVWRGQYRVVVSNGCGSVTSQTFTVCDASCAPACDSIDFNNNTVFPEDQDVIDFFSVLAGGECSTCNDIDFNNNTVFPEDADVIAFFNVLAGGACGG